jgi:hypothetical protein
MVGASPQTILGSSTTFGAMNALSFMTEPDFAKQF